jgi:tetratricopeptide (TPR) repeat protein
MSTRPAATWLVIAMLCAGVFIGCGGQEETPDDGAAAKAAVEQLAAKVKGLMDSGGFKQAASTIGEFFEQYPDVPGSAKFWGLKIVCHRKTNDLTSSLLTAAKMDEKLIGPHRGRGLCEAGDVLVWHECFADAASAFELASAELSVHERACYQAAICNYRLGRFAKAMMYIDVVATIRPHDPKVIDAVKRIEDARFVMDK